MNSRHGTWEVKAKPERWIKYYYKGTVDSNDTHRMDQARDEFHQMIREEELKGLPVLLLCNKQDLPNAWSPEKIRDLFKSSSIQNPVLVVGCVATKNNGIKPGLEWLRQLLSKDTQRGPTPEDHPVPTNEKAKPQLPKLDYSPTLKGKNATLQRFQAIQQASCCPFAKKTAL